MKNKLSLVLATYNEEKNIKSCLDSVKSIADEIVVVDGSSQDKTRQIARQFGARVYKTENRPMFHTNKQMAIDQANNEWILQLDADEVVTLKLLSEIREIKKKGSKKYSAFFLKRKNIFLGSWLKKGGQYPDPVIRLFKNGKARLPQKSVHEQMKVDGEVGMLKGHLIHNTAPSFDRYLTNANRYTSLTASDLMKNGVIISPKTFFSYLVAKPITTFFALFIRHKGFLDGFAGFIFALFSGIHWQIAYLKLWENYYTQNQTT